MEKLQSALAKAREARSSTDPTQAEHSPRERAESVSNSIAVEGWDRIAELEYDAKKAHKSKIVAMSVGSDSIPFDILRTKLLLQIQRNNWKRIAITSPMPASGKTTVAANLAASFGRQKDSRTVLFEFDMRRPRLAKMFGVTPPHDVSDLLLGNVTFEEQALRLEKNVAISMAAHSTVDQTNLFLSDKTEQVLQSIEQDFAPDLLIFDLPPLLTGDETRAFLKHVDCGLLVLRAEQTSLAHADLAEREIAEHTNVAGMILNRCRFAMAAEPY